MLMFHCLDYSVTIHGIENYAWKGESLISVRGTIERDELKSEMFVVFRELCVASSIILRMK